mgnify:CR=1 FL=1
MATAQVIADVGIKPDAILRRYLDLPKLLDLLHFKAMYFRRADGFTDRLEGALFPTLRTMIDKIHALGEADESADEFYHRARTFNYVSCWTLGGKDSMALWQLYGGVHTSIAMTTTFQRLCRVAMQWQRRVLIHRVKYVHHPNVKTFVVGAYSDL